MTVTVRLFATFREYLPPDARHVGRVMHIAAGATVRDLLVLLQIPDDLPRIVLVNGRYAAEHEPLHEDDHVAVFPPLIGGR
jgi:molybdopterin converting factor small subunit